MPKRKRTLRFRLPPYVHPRNQWRRKIHEAAIAQVETTGVSYVPSDAIEVHIRLYFSRAALEVHDVDNRTKDVLDALQGRAGGSKTSHAFAPIIPNDRQVIRVSVEKLVAPKQSRGGFGHVLVRAVTE